jgi:hypothetical protein
MQKTKPEDTPKIIALAAAIIAVFAYVIYSFMRGTSAPAGETVRTAAANPSSNQLMGQPFASNDPSAMTPGSTPDTAGQADALLSDNAVLPTSSRDPFRSPVAGAPQGGAQVGAQYAPQNIPSGQPQGTLSANVSGTPGGAASSTPMQVEAPPPSEVELKGVVSGGTRPMALIRIGNTLMNVYEGQKITKDLVVKKIGVASVEIRHQNEMLNLEVGNMLMASIVLPESVVLANPSVSSPAPMAGEAIDMSNANVATPVYSAPQDLQGVAPAQPAGSRLGPY